jgi:hypothetical protein
MDPWGHYIYHWCQTSLGVLMINYVYFVTRELVMNLQKFVRFV